MNENEENPFLSIFEENQSFLGNDTEKESRNENKEKVHQEQGWYPWLVVACSFLCICVLDGVGYSFGVLFEPLLKDLSDGHGRGTLAIAGSLQIGVYGFSSPLVAKIVDKYGERIPCMIGAIISAGGLVLSSYASDIVTLILGYSVVTGIGFGCMYLPSIVIVPKYFIKYRSLAIGIVLCAAGVGTFVVAPVTQAMVDTWGWRGAMRGLAIIAASCFFCGMIMKPKTLDQEESSEDNSPSRSSSCLGKILGPHMSSSPGLSLFLILGVADMLSTLSIYIPYTHLPSAAEARGISSSMAAMLISTVGVSNTIGRLVSGWMSDQPWGHPMVTITSAITAAAPCLFIMSFVSQFWLLIITCAVFGFSTGIWVSAIPPALIRLLGQPSLSTAFGLLTFSRGTAALGGPPLAGVVVDMFDDKGIAMVVAGVGMSLSCVIFTMVMLINKRRELRLQYQEL